MKKWAFSEIGYLDGWKWRTNNFIYHLVGQLVFFFICIKIYWFNSNYMLIPIYYSISIPSLRKCFWYLNKRDCNRFQHLAYYNVYGTTMFLICFFINFFLSYIIIISETFNCFLSTGKRKILVLLVKFRECKQR